MGQKLVTKLVKQSLQIGQDFFPESDWKFVIELVKKSSEICRKLIGKLVGHLLEIGRCLDRKFVENTLVNRNIS